MSVKSVSTKLGRLVQRCAWFPPLLGRISVGAVFAESGWGKVHNVEHVTGFFTDLGIPAPHFHAVLVANVELYCGAAILLGVLTRLASLPLIATMIVAISTAKLGDIHETTDLLGMSEFLYIVILVWLVIEGPGCISLDALVWRRSKTAA